MFTVVYLLVVELDLTSAGDMQITQLWLQIRVHLQLQDSLADLALKRIRLGTAGLDHLGSENHLQENKNHVNICSNA